MAELKSVETEQVRAALQNVKDHAATLERLARGGINTPRPEKVTMQCIKEMCRQIERLSVRLDALEAKS
ncbi:hypothetical protein ATO8_09181 [Roseivivax marinus]|uniref:Uncharacterized protein n=1 Tax=Roseivivax marinus TaxID=1379903 RepID=W4HKY9_9RHOB|nr:hypothetical protein [Roseivivax marinus]ETW13374.1 hypothetical protein ATO8_09181 [Roseivivax marinus]